MSTYQIGEERHSTGGGGLQHALERARLSKIRPLCLCSSPAVPMYITPVEGRLIVKRMPNSGRDHAPSCDSYEPPPELSGLGQVLGSAIQEDPEAGVTAIKFDFSLRRIGGRAPPVVDATQSDSAKTDGSKLSLRATLHYLWDQAGFNRWSPAMEGRRSWYTIRKFLLQSTENKIAKGSSLREILFVPEAFHVDRKAEIARRRVDHMNRTTSQGGQGARRLMLVIGEVKEFSPSRYGHKVAFKQLPDCPFMLSDDMHRRLVCRFNTELGLWDALEDTHLLAIGTFGVGATGIASLEEMALMTTTANWIPIESSYDKTLVDEMTSARRRFVKGLRYNLATQVPLACLVASDTKPCPTAMYIVPPDSSQGMQRALAALREESSLQGWTWQPAGEVMPPMPPVDSSSA